MQIISGKYKNIIIDYPASIRPSTAKHKKMVFDTIRFDLPGAYMVDIFSGSGQMGLEALSLGADYVQFVDSSPKCTKIIKDNIRRINIDPGQYDIVCTNAKKFIEKCEQKFDIIMADPPYLDIDWKELADIYRISKDSSILIVKYSPHNPPPELINWKLIKQKDANDTIINFYLRS